MKTTYQKANDEGITQACKLLKKGEIVAIPTETVYGIAADATNDDAVKKIFIAKGRPQDNPLIVHVAGIDSLGEIVRKIPESAHLLAAAFWPGPLTMVLPVGNIVASSCTAGLDTVAVRAPSHPVAQKILKESGLAFAAPSANVSGSPSPTCASDVLADMDGRLPLILDGGDCEVGVESTVLSLSGDKPLLLRPGLVTVEQIEFVLGQEVAVSHAVTHALPQGEKVQSPGMKYKHYAPKAKITLVDGTFKQFKKFVQAHKEENPTCLCFSGEEEKLDYPAMNYGEEMDGASQAKHVFRALRALDEMGADVVYARAPQKSGVSMAVYNRLVRAAAFRIVEL